MSILFHGRMTLSMARSGLYPDQDALRAGLYRPACVAHARICLAKVWRIGHALPEEDDSDDDPTRVIRFLEAYRFAVFGDEGGVLRATAIAALEAFETALITQDAARCAAFCTLFAAHEALLLMSHGGGAAAADEPEEVD